MSNSDASARVVAINHSDLIAHNSAPSVAEALVVRLHAQLVTQQQQTAKLEAELADAREKLEHMMLRNTRLLQRERLFFDTPSEYLDDADAPNDGNVLSTTMPLDHLREVELALERSQRRVRQAIEQRLLGRAAAADRCVICLSGSRECCTMPCAHLATCTACAVPLQRCPICREQIQQTLRVYPC